MSDRYHGYYAGFDLGGTQLKYGVIEAGGRLAFKNKVPSPPDINHLMTLIGSIWKELENKFGRKIKAAGFGFAGFYSLARKRILYSPNYQALNNFPLVPHLKKIIPDCIIKVVGNKIDLIEPNQLDDLKSKMIIPCDILTSAKTGENVDGLFIQLATELLAS